MNKFVHLVYIPFTGVGLFGGYRGDEWFRDRVEVFKRYTLKSLEQQVCDKDAFVIWLSFRPEEEKHPYTAELANYLKEENFQYILTFNGLMYWDDKFTTECYPKLLNAARIVRECWRNKNFINLFRMIFELWKNKNKDLQERIQQSVSLIETNFPKVDWVYVTRLDSDDMLHKNAIAEIQSKKPFMGAYTMRRGYIYNSNTGQLAEYNPTTNPPFHTIIFPADTFFCAEKYLKYFGNFRSHEDIPFVFETIKLSNGLYCVFTHNPKMHISTIWKHPYRGKEIEGTGRENILQNFGIYS